MEVDFPYLVRSRTGRLSFRHVFTPETRPFLPGEWQGKTELKVSLKARSIHEPGALAIYQGAAKLYDALVAQARKAALGLHDDLTAPQIAFLAETYRVQELADDAEARLDPEVKARGDLVTTAAQQAGWDIPPHRPSARWSQGFRIAIEAALDVYRGFSADGDLEGIRDAWGDRAASLAAAEGLHVDRSSSGFTALCLRLNEAAIAAHELELERLDGKVVPTPPAPERPLTPLARPAAPTSPSGQTFRAILLELVDNPRHNFTETTKERVRGGLRLLVEAVGDLRPSELTRERVTHFLDLLAQRPAKLPKEDLHLALPELVAKYAERADVPRLTQKTQEAYVIALSARWKEATEDGHIPKALENPFSERHFRREGRRRGSPVGFNEAELKAYFSLPCYAGGERPVRGKGEAIYWVPLLLLFTGARPEEVAQLLVADIFQRDRDERWVIRFTDEGEHPVKGRQSLKTEKSESGRRTFPLPQALLDLGLLDYCDYLRGHGEVALFPLLRRKGKRPGIYASFGEWMGPYVYANGVLKEGENRQPVREFRHTWATAARVSRIPKEARKYIQGHKDGDDRSASDDYGELEVLGDHIDDLRLTVDILDRVPRWTAPAA